MLSVSSVVGLARGVSDVCLLKPSNCALLEKKLLKNLEGRERLGIYVYRNSKAPVDQFAVTLVFSSFQMWLSIYDLLQGPKRKLGSTGS